MTIERKYICNLCRRTINDINPGRGFRWTEADNMEFVAISTTENHFCGGCIAGLDKLLASIRSGEP